MRKGAVLDFRYMEREIGVDFSFYLYYIIDK